jgi:hypothetical protein
LYFEENRGQTASEVRYLARASGYTAYLTGRETVLHYRTGSRDGGDAAEAVVRMTLAGSNPPSSIQAADRLAGVVNYLIGNDPSKWRTRIPTFGEVDYREVYPGVDLVYRGMSQQLEFDFRVAPGADPNQIRMAYAGASKIHVNTAGDLILDTSAGAAPIRKPLVYQDLGQDRVLVAASYRLLPNGEVGFQLGRYDRSLPLVIDPVMLSRVSVYYATYLGSGAGDSFHSIAVDSAGEAFICGTTSSTSFPVSGGVVRTTFPSGVSSVGFVTALNAAGTGIKYSTYIAGTDSTKSNNGTPKAIAVDASGFAFIGGDTDDSTFPMVKAFQSTIPGLSAAPSNYDHSVGIVFELAQNGATLVYSSFLGGGDPYNTINAIAVDSGDNAYVTGTLQTYSNGSGVSHPAHFQTTSGVIWPNFTQSDIGAGFDDAFAAKIAPPVGAGNATLAYSTVIGSATAIVAITSGTAIAVDPSGNAYVAGTTNGDVGDHGGTITTRTNMTHASPGAGGEYVTSVWVLELNSGATSAVYLDYLGGSTPSGTYSPDTSVAGIAVDSAGQAYVTGTTQANNFQTTSNAYQAAPQAAGITSSVTNFQSDAYVTIIAGGGGSFAYSTYLNGTTVTSEAAAENYDATPGVAGIALGTGGAFAIAGYTDTSNFPTFAPSVPGTPVRQSFPTGKDFAMFVTKFQPPLLAGGGLFYSAFVGQGGENIVDGIASNGSDVYVMISGAANGLGTGGAYDLDNSSLQKELIVRVSDAGAFATSLTVDNKSAPPSGSPQPVSLTSTVTPVSSTVNGGTVTYTVTNASSTQIGSAVTSGIVSTNAAPPTTYTLPGNTPAGTYTIHANYTAAEGFLSSSSTGTLTVGVTTAGVTIASSPTGLTFSVSGTGCAPGSGLVAPQTLQWTPGSACTVTFATPQAGAPGTQFVFTNWEDNSVNAARGITAPSSTATYTATFKTQYQLTTSASPGAGGSVTPASGQYYDSGTVVSLQAAPNSGYVFTSWSGSVASSSSASTTVTMSAPQTVSATFTHQAVLAVSVTPANGGSVTGTIGGQPFSCSTTCSALVTFGTQLTLTATPASGYSFTSWGVCPSPSGSSCTVTMNGTTTVSAVFTGSTPFTYTQSAPVLNHASGLFSRTVTVTNNGPAVSGAAYVADGLPAGVIMVSPSGTTSATLPAGSPYKELGPIGANSSVTVTIQFSRTATQAITYTVRILGPGAR